MLNIGDHIGDEADMRQAVIVIIEDSLPRDLSIKGAEAVKLKGILQRSRGVMLVLDLIIVLTTGLLTKAWSKVPCDAIKVTPQRDSAICLIDAVEMP